MSTRPRFKSYTGRALAQRLDKTPPVEPEHRIIVDVRGDVTIITDLDFILEPTAT